MEKKEQGNKSSTTVLVSVLFSFLLSLLLVLTSLLIITRIAVSKTAIENLVKSEDFYNILLTNIEDQARDYTIPTGIDTSVPTGVFSIDDISFDIYNYVECAFLGSPYEPNILPLQKRIKAKATDFYANNVEMTEEILDVIEAYSDDICELYSTNINITGLNYICDFCSVFSRLFPLFMFFAIAGIFFLIRLCIKLQNFPHRGLRYVAYASGGASLILFVGPFVLFISKIYTRININNYPLYFLVTSFVKNTLMLLFIAAAVLTVTVFVLLFVISKKKLQLTKE